MHAWLWEVYSEAMMVETYHCAYWGWETIADGQKPALLADPPIGPTKCQWGLSTSSA